MTPGKPAFYFFISADPGLLQDQIREFEKKFEITGKKWGKKVFWGDEIPDEAFWNSLGQEDLFSQPRCLILRRANEWSAAHWKTISKRLENISARILPLVCIEVEYEKRRFKIPAHIQKLKCFELAKKQGWLKEVLPLSSNNLKKYIENFLTERSCSFSSDLVNKIANIIKPDALSIKNELSKLQLLSKNNEITEDLLFYLNDFQDENIFQLILKLEQGNLAYVWKEISGSVQGNLLFSFIALMARDLKILWNYANGTGPPFTFSEMQLKKELAKKIGKIGISRGFGFLVDAEMKVKSGAASPEQTLEDLIINFFQLFYPANNKKLL